MNRYIEHIIKDLVRDTRIDYEIGRIYFPFLLPYYHLITYQHHNSFLTSTPIDIFISFINYCKERYGLTEEEINYVWDQYTNIIKDKIDNGR
jgi:hypothetical protein